MKMWKWAVSSQYHDNFLETLAKLKMSVPPGASKAALAAAKNTAVAALKPVVDVVPRTANFFTWTLIGVMTTVGVAVSIGCVSIIARYTIILLRRTKKHEKQTIHKPTLDAALKALRNPDISSVERQLLLKVVLASAGGWPGAAVGANKAELADVLNQNHEIPTGSKIELSERIAVKAAELAKHGSPEDALAACSPPKCVRTATTCACPNAWNEFRGSRAGQGLTSEQMQTKYATFKRKHSTKWGKCLNDPATLCAMREKRLGTTIGGALPFWI